MKGNILLIPIIICLIAALSGSCHKSCAVYYTGKNCTPVNQIFVGTYSGGLIVTADAHSNPPVADSISISAGIGPDTILLNNVTSPIKCTVTADGDSFAVLPQTVTYSSVPLVILSGTGSLHNDTLTASISATSGGLPVGLTYTGVR